MTENIIVKCGDNVRVRVHPDTKFVFKDFDDVGGGIVEGLVAIRDPSLPLGRVVFEPARMPRKGAT